MTARLDVASAYGRVAASTRVRVLDWLAHLSLEAEVHQYLGASTATMSTFGAHPLRVLRAQRALYALAKEPLDRLVIQREASPLGDGAIEARLLTRAQHGVLDLDDAMEWDSLRPGLGGHLWPKAEKTARALPVADCVIAGNPILAEAASRWARHVVVIPSCVQPSLYRRKRDYELHDPPRVLWIGSASTERFLAVVAGPMEELHRTTGARLVVLGSPKRSRHRLEAMIDRVPWSEQRVLETTAEFDLGIMPLDDSLYSRGKCAYKLLQYGAAALPMIGSPVGVNATVLDGFGMPACTSDDEWVDAFLQLLGESGAARSEAGARAHAATVARYSFSAWQEDWLEAVGLSSRSALSSER